MADLLKERCYSYGVAELLCRALGSSEQGVMSATVQTLHAWMVIASRASLLGQLRGKFMELANACFAAVIFC